MATKSQSKLTAKSSKTSSNVKREDKSKRVSIGNGEGFERPQLVNKVLTTEQSKELLLLSVEDVQDQLCDIFQLSGHTTDLKQSSTLDYYTSAVWWGKENGFSSEQLSAIFTIIHTLLENVTEKRVHIIDNIKEMKRLLTGMDVDSSDQDKSLFDVATVRKVSDYIYESFFQHYKLYEFMSTHKQSEEIIGTDLDVEIAKPAHLPFPAPLEEGVTKDIFETYIVTPTKSPIPDSEEEKEEVSKVEKKTPDLFANLTPEDLRSVMDTVAREMLGGLQHEMATKLREKENQILQRINKIHNVAD